MKNPSLIYPCSPEFWVAGFRERGPGGPTAGSRGPYEEGRVSGRQLGGAEAAGKVPIRGWASGNRVGKERKMVVSHRQSFHKNSLEGSFGNRFFVSYNVYSLVTSSLTCASKEHLLAVMRVDQFFNLSHPIPTFPTASGSFLSYSRQPPASGRTTPACGWVKMARTRPIDFEPEQVSA